MRQGSLKQTDECTHAPTRSRVARCRPPRLFRGSSDRLLGNVCLIAVAVTEPEARPAPSGAAAAASEPVPEGPALAPTGRRYGKARGFTRLQDGAPGPGAARPSAWPFSTGDVALGGHSGRDGASVRKREGRSPAAPRSQTRVHPHAHALPGTPAQPSGAGGPVGPAPCPPPRVEHPPPPSGGHEQVLPSGAFRVIPRKAPHTRPPRASLGTVPSVTGWTEAAPLSAPVPQRHREPGLGAGLASLGPARSPVSGQDVHERGLPGPRRTHDGHQLPAVELPRNSFQEGLVSCKKKIP